MESNRKDFLVETTWLAEHLNDPHLRVVDMRGYVRNVVKDGVPDALYTGARDEYQQGHILGALYIDWTSDIVDPNDVVEVQVAPAQRFAEAMEQLGIGDQHLVVAYDAHPTSQFATRLWWALNYYGHREVVILNGGLAKWRRENLPLDTNIPTYPAATFTPEVQPQLRATAEEMLTYLEQQDITLVDARDRGQYTGEVVRGHSRAGHIPGSQNFPREEVIDPTTGTFRSNEELVKLYNDAGITPQEHVIAYCNGGVAATTVLFTLAMLGYPHLTNYDGSWNEWGKRSDLPVEL